MFAASERARRPFLPMPGEFDLIRRYFTRPAARALLGVGDDAAILRPAVDRDLAVSTDTLNEGVHFLAGTAPRLIGHKSLAVNLSDLAAMGATPRWATLAITLPSADESWVAAFVEGFFELAGRFGVDLVGGDTTRGPLSITVTIAGDLPRGAGLLRSNARTGDDLWVSGELGAAALALRHRKGEIALPADIGRAAGSRLDSPEPRIELGERLLGLAHAAIDVSDGFAADLGHMLERSGVAATIEYERLPHAACFRSPDASPAVRAAECACVLSGGDDYELVFTAAADRRGAIDSLANRLGLLLSRVGEIRPGPPRLTILDAKGSRIDHGAGFDHFAR